MHFKLHTAALVCSYKVFEGAHLPKNLHAELPKRHAPHECLFALTGQEPQKQSTYRWLEHCWTHILVGSSLPPDVSHAIQYGFCQKSVLHNSIDFVRCCAWKMACR